MKIKLQWFITKYKKIKKIIKKFILKKNIVFIWDFKNYNKILYFLNFLMYFYKYKNTKKGKYEKEVTDNSFYYASFYG